MELTITILFGLIIGSFLNVCIYRVPRKMSVVFPQRSFCPKCQAQISWWENIPVLSWLILGAKCRHCREPISGQYPLVELLSALAAAATWIHFGLTPTGLVVYALTAALIVITFIDFEFKIIPDVISFPGMTLGMILGIASQYTGAFDFPVTQSAWDSLVGFLIGAGFFYVISRAYLAATDRVGLGGGDVKLMGMTGAIMGYQSVIPTLFAGSMLGAAVGILTIVVRGGGRHTEIPFGPWLSIGALLYVFADLAFFRIF